MNDLKTIEELYQTNTPLKEVELMLTTEELQKYAKYCIDNDIKFNDWVRKLAFDALKK